MSATPVHLNAHATLFHTDADDLSLRVAWNLEGLTRDPSFPGVVELLAERVVDGRSYHLQCYIDPCDVRPRSVGRPEAFQRSGPTDAGRREAVRLAWAADVVALAPQLITPGEVLRLSRNGAEGRLKRAREDIHTAQRALTDAQEAARRAEAVHQLVLEAGEDA